MNLTGAQALLESLRREGVEVIFGYPGGQVIPIYDAIYREGFKHILTRHEQGAVHAADGYARSTGRPGVCLATSGPGATNLVTGLATAYMDSVPIVALTGQVPTSMLGRDSFQEADITGITMPITKHNYLVKNVSELPRIIKEAFYIATTGRPGPVLIDLPKDVSVSACVYSYPETLSLPGYKPVYEGNVKQIKAAVAALETAKKPLIYAGGGVTISGAEEELLRLAEKAEIPVTATLMGLTAFPGTHPLFLGMLGMHGAVAANYAVTSCDLLIAVGARFDDRVTGQVSTFAPNARIVHLDIDPAEIGKNVRVDIPIVGDAKHILAALLSLLSAEKHEQWLKEVNKWKSNHPLVYQPHTDYIMPQAVVETILELTDGEAIICTEVGQNQMWAAQFYRFTRPRSFITSGGLGTMGFGFPAAIGAQVGNPERVVIDIAGDGSIQMNIQELATIASYQLPVKIIILNNGYLGMVRQWQEFFFEKRYSEVALNNPDFAKVAEAYGIKAYTVKKPEELKRMLTAVLNHPGPALLNCLVHPEENVLPMVPPNGSIHQMLGVGEV
ncbi:MAG TPA: biosynthetic-type acetolactate synthase large subunit [Firmicutes bacterium]|jgi:acetolactate synthase-1/2/3 large subunit|nr:biosynthetic-type acetolactate synthase large subunit [Bacillota bacterium]HBT15455.1 biosynthetic-type acetolactate synthase large subunit [Bacillota bacterium]